MNALTRVGTKDANGGQPPRLEHAAGQRVRETIHPSKVGADPCDRDGDAARCADDGCGLWLGGSPARRLEGRTPTSPRIGVCTLRSGHADQRINCQSDVWTFRRAWRAHLCAGSSRGRVSVALGRGERGVLRQVPFRVRPTSAGRDRRGLAALLPPDIEILAGLELGGVPLAAVASQVSGLPTVFVRKRAKTYGTCRLAEGGEIAGRRVAVIEDVVTSGGQVIESCRELRNQEADVAAVLCVIDREAGGRENLAVEGLDLRALFTMSQLQEVRATDSVGL